MALRDVLNKIQSLLQSDSETRPLTHLHLQFIPESARFNVSSGNDKAALVTLQWIAKMNRSVMPEGKLVEPVDVRLQSPE